MIIFAPNKIIRAVEIIEKQHPLSGELSAGISGEELKALVLRINEKEFEGLDNLAKTLTRRQVKSLCDYLPINTYKVDIDKITKVIRFKMSKEYFPLLFHQWEKYPECLQCLNILGDFDREEYRPDSFMPRRGLLSQWGHAERPYLAMARTINDQGVSGSFDEKFKSFGFKPNTQLQRHVYWTYLSNASKPQLTAEGDYKISQTIGPLSREMQGAVIYRILYYGSTENDFMKGFPKLYQIALGLWGEPNRVNFPEEALFKAYLWWYNYNQLVQTLTGDNRRIRFWQPYLGLCQCSQRKEHGMLIMDFGKYVVTEFQTDGPTYIFQSQYFFDTVYYQMNKYRTYDFKSWLFNYAKWNSRLPHYSNWEIKEHAELRRLSII